MKIQLQTKVEQDLPRVKQGFNKDLFVKLNPPFPKVKLLRFDGSRRGDKVSVELDFILFKQKWTSIITSDRSDDSESYFVDEGRELPFFLRLWRHKHRLISDSEGTLIRDEITFSARPKLLGIILYPAIYLQFWYRKPIYRKTFKRS